MELALRVKTRVQPGGKVEVCDPQLRAGSTVDVTIVAPDVESRPSIVDVLASAPGHLAFRTAEEVDAYLRLERDAWER